MILDMHSHSILSLENYCQFQLFKLGESISQKLSVSSTPCYLLSEEQTLCWEDGESVSWAVFQRGVWCGLFVVVCALCHMEGKTAHLDRACILGGFTHQKHTISPPFSPRGLSRPTFGLRPGLPLLFLRGLTGFFLARSSRFSGTAACVSTLIRAPLFLESSSGWIRGSTPPFDMVTPRRSWGRRHKRRGGFGKRTVLNIELHFFDRV